MRDELETFRNRGRGKWTNELGSTIPDVLLD